MSKITNELLNPVWQRMLYSCTHNGKMGVKGLENIFRMFLLTKSESEIVLNPVNDRIRVSFLNETVIARSKRH